VPWRRWSRGWRRGSPGWQDVDPAATMGGEGTGTLRAGTGTGRERRRRWGTAASVGNVVAALGCFPSALRSLRSVGFVGEGFGSGQLGRPCPGPPPILYSAGDGGPPAIMTGRPRSGHDQRGFGPIFGSGLEIISNNYLMRFAPVLLF